jgi:hypothetical protein
MVKASLALLRCIHGDRDDQQMAGPGNGRVESFDTVCQTRSQAIGDWLHAVVLKQVDQLAQLPFISAVGHGLDEGGWRQPAGLAEGISIVTRFGKRKGGYSQIFATTSAKISRLGVDLSAAGIADRGAGKPQKGVTTKGAGRRKQNAGEGIRRTSQHTNHSAPNRSLRHRNVECQGNPLTLEDAPLKPADEVWKLPAAHRSLLCA